MQTAEKFITTKTTEIPEIISSLSLSELSQLKVLCMKLGLKPSVRPLGDNATHIFEYETNHGITPKLFIQLDHQVKDKQVVLILFSNDSVSIAYIELTDSPRINLFPRKINIDEFLEVNFIDDFFKEKSMNLDDERFKEATLLNVDDTNLILENSSIAHNRFLELLM